MTWNRFRPYCEGDLLTIWPDLREEDRREYAAVGLTDPGTVEVLLRSFHPRMQTWDSDAGPLGVLGVTPGDDPGVGHVWAIVSDAARPRWRFAVRETERVLREMSSGFLVLSNVKDARNTAQIAWLKKLGFTFIGTHEDYLGSGVPFHEFVRIVT